MTQKSLYVTRAVDFMGTQTDGVAASSTNTYYSLPFHSDRGQNLQIQSTGDLTGAFTLWYSSKERPVLADDDDWTEDTAFSPDDPAGTPVNFTVDNVTAMARWKRLKYVNVSGTGSIFAYVAHDSAEAA